MEHSSGIFIFNNKNEVCICHPTGTKWGWSIPKGHIDDKETKLETALREVLEETNIDLYDFRDNIIYIGEQQYVSKKKTLYAFFYKYKTDIKFDLKCNSYVPLDSKWNPGLPENDIIKFVNVDVALELLQEAHKILLQRIIDLDLL